MTELTVKLTSPNGSWEDVQPIVQAVVDGVKSMDFDDVHIEVGDVWRNAPKKNNVIQYNGDSSEQTVFFNQQNNNQNN